MVNNEFDREIKYKLFRTVNEILHPTISKKNISDYKIIMDDGVLPVRVFYPKQVTHIDKVIIYVHGNGEVTNCMEKYSEICKNFSIKTNCLVMAIEYDDITGGYEMIVDEVNKSINYLYDKLIMNSINANSIILMSDSTGSHIVSLIKDIPIKKRILFYPVLKTNYIKKDMKNEDFNIGLIERINKYFKDLKVENDAIIENKDSLVLVGSIDMLMDDIKNSVEGLKKIKFVDVPFSGHGFLNDMDKELSNDVFTIVNKFI